MTFSVCGIGAAETAVAFRTDEEIGVDPVDHDASLTLTHPGNCQHVVIEGSNTELLALLDRARAVVLERVIATRRKDGADEPARELRTYEITIDTDSPDFLARFIHATDMLRDDLSTPADGNCRPRRLLIDVNEWDPQRERSDHLWSAAYEPGQGA
ncbi:hypothetical protein ACQFYA_21275 [Promicromonospora sp. Marseille-Q5078]